MAHEHRICSVQQGSIAWEMGIEPGDKLLAVDGLYRGRGACTADREAGRRAVGAGD